MLDLSFFVGPRCEMTNKLDFELYVKPTSIWRPLSPQSCHTPNVHKHWPLAQLKRIEHRFSCAARAGREKTEFIRNFEEVTGVEMPRNNRSSDRHNSTPVSSWIVIPYCGAWSFFRSRVLKDVYVPESLHGLFGSVRVSWSLWSRHLIHLLRSHSRNLPGWKQREGWRV